MFESMDIWVIVGGWLLIKTIEWVASHKRSVMTYQERGWLEGLYTMQNRVDDDGRPIQTRILDNVKDVKQVTNDTHRSQEEILILLREISYNNQVITKALEKIVDRLIEMGHH